jgi:hypothetical protein
MLTPIVVTVLAPLVFTKLPYDPLVDFAPVAHVANFQFAMSVAATHPAKNVQELVEWWKANKPMANFGSPAPGSLPHFFGVMIERSAGVDLVHVPVQRRRPADERGDGQSGVERDRHAGRPDRAAPHRQDPPDRNLGRTAQPAAARGADLREGGLKGVEGHQLVRGLRAGEDAGRHRAPAQRVDQQGARGAELRERFMKLGLEPTGGTPADLSARMAQDTARWSPVVKASGFKAD